VLAARPTHLIRCELVLPHLSSTFRSIAVSQRGHGDSDLNALLDALVEAAREHVASLVDRGVERLDAVAPQPTQVAQPIVSRLITAARTRR